MKKSQLHKNWISTSLFLIFVTLSIVIFTNYINDPLWSFSHSNFLNKKQSPINERQQKTNFLYFGKKDYNSIMLGNSKVTYINQNRFKIGKLFNYSVSAMRPEEYNGYIEFAKETLNKDLKYIIIGLDFNSCTKQKEKIEDPQFYIKKTKSEFYRYSQLLSYNTFLYSLRNFMKYFDNKKSFYDRHNIKIKVGYDQKYPDYKFDEEKLKKDSQEKYQTTQYNDNLPQIWQNIKKNNPQSKIIFILLPDLLPDFLINENGKKIFNKCFDDATYAFGLIYNFMYFNDITTHPKHYYDMSHFKPYVGDMILDNINLYNPIDIR